MTDFDYTGMRKNRRQALFELRIWLDEVQRWHAEHRRAASMLAAARENVLETEAKLDSHTATILAEDSQWRQHDREVGKRSRNGKRVGRGRLRQEHQELESAHTQASEAHEEMKRRHQSVMAEIRQLLNLTRRSAPVRECTPSPDN
jgi:hypothetical protein